MRNVKDLFHIAAILEIWELAYPVSLRPLCGLCNLQTLKRAWVKFND